MIEKFEHALAAELNRAPTYVARKHGIYATQDLAESARQVFSETVRAAIPAAVLEEVDAAGRALAFDFGTASAVHMLRAVDAMLRLYFEAYVDADTAKGERNYAAHLKKLAALADDEDKDKSQRPDRRVLQMLAQIKEHYRNPLLTPEGRVGVDEAMQLFGMGSALIALMIEHISARRQAAKKTREKGNVTPLIDPLLDDDGETADYPLSQAG